MASTDQYGAVLARLARANQTVDDARADRAAFIRREWRAGVRPSDIARNLRAAAEKEGLTPEQIQALGISESSVRLTLKLAAAREAGDVDDEEA
jgi:hypothetical protein